MQLHGAHGYLLSEFLSPDINTRTDEWGGSLENRARLLIESIRAVRKAVGSKFPVALKLNSSDFQKGGFSHADAVQVASWLGDEGLDLLEVSGGTYEQPKLLGLDNMTTDATRAERVRASTVAREAYFLDYAKDIRAAQKARSWLREVSDRVPVWMRLCKPMLAILSGWGGRSAWIPML